MWISEYALNKGGCSKAFTAVELSFPAHRKALDKRAKGTGQSWGGKDILHTEHIMIRGPEACIEWHVFFMSKDPGISE